jgi:hypothetical protein
MEAQYLRVAEQAARTAGQYIRQAWSRPRMVKHKGTVDLVRYRRRHILITGPT